LLALLVDLVGGTEPDEATAVMFGGSFLVFVDPVIIDGGGFAIFGDGDDLGAFDLGCVSAQEKSHHQEEE